MLSHDARDARYSSVMRNEPIETGSDRTGSPAPTWRCNDRRGQGNQRQPILGGVQSLGRAFAILETMADAGGIIGLSQLSEKADLPLATIHRLIRTLVDLGYVRQEASRQYSLGPRLMRLANTSSKRIGDLGGPSHERRGCQAG